MIKHRLYLCVLLLMASTCLAATTMQSAYIKEAKKIAKSYTKKGWKIKDQSTTLNEQFVRYYTMLYAKDKNQTPTYISGIASSEAGTYNGALRVATMQARRNLTTSMSVRVEAYVEANIKNRVGDTNDVALTADIVAYSQQLVGERLVEATTFTMYRVNKQGNTEVCVMLLYPWAKAVQTMEEATDYSK